VAGCLNSAKPGPTRASRHKPIIGSHYFSHLLPARAHHTTGETQRTPVSVSFSLLVGPHMIMAERFRARWPPSSCFCTVVLVLLTGDMPFFVYDGFPACLTARIISSISCQMHRARIWVSQLSVSWAFLCTTGVWVWFPCPVSSNLVSSEPVYTLNLGPWHMAAGRPLRLASPKSSQHQASSPR
jgi:hypothetical protein